MNKSLKALLKFVEFTNLFADVKRKTILNKDGTAENNAQHSFQLAIVAWYIAEMQSLKLNIEKLIKYALVHDLVETYSGNFPAYGRKSKNQSLKDNEENESKSRIKKEFEEFVDLTTQIDLYFRQTDKESRFIYALDKLLPIINIELNNNDFYLQTQTTYEEMLVVKEKKIQQDSTIYYYFQLLIDYLNSEANFFWPNNKNRDYSKKKYNTD